MDYLMEKFNQSISLDKRLCFEDIEGSKAYAKSLSRADILSESEKLSIIDGLTKIESEWKTDTFKIKNSDEDIHSANERRLTELIGPIGGKLHTGRSRNDQISTDTRLWLIKEVYNIKQLINKLLIIICERAEKEIEYIMPGFTHLQPAQVIRWSQWLLAHAASWMRDDERYTDIIPRISTLPLGSGALAGNAFGIDREYLSKELKFKKITLNSIDSVSDRDFVIEFIFVSSLLMTHFSRFAEDLIIYSSPFFGFVQCSDAYTTGSSLMPQKKNPDALELLRGKCGNIHGNLISILVTMKGTPLAYNKDFQEVWKFMFDTRDSILDCLNITIGIINHLTIFPNKMKSSLTFDMLATDIADYLVRKNIPFRETHNIAGKVVNLSEDLNCPLNVLTLSQLKTIHPLFDDDIYDVLDFEKSVESRNSLGGSSKTSVLKQIDDIKNYVSLQKF